MSLIRLDTLTINSCAWIVISYNILYVWCLAVSIFEEQINGINILSNGNKDGEKTRIAEDVGIKQKQDNAKNEEEDDDEKKATNNNPSAVVVEFDCQSKDDTVKRANNVQTQTPLRPIKLFCLHIKCDV